MDHLKKYIREVPDFPKPGILFYDVTTLLEMPAAYRKALDAMETYAKSREANKIVAIESRGFIMGGALADRLSLSLVIARKPGKLPYQTESMRYDLEYGSDSLEIHADTIFPGDRILLVDDLIATGGTLLATARLIEKLGGEIVGVSAMIALDFLPWEEKLADYDVNALVRYQTG